MDKLLDFLKANLALILVILLGGYMFMNNSSPQVVEKVVEKPVIQEVVHREVINTVQVKEKANPNDADIVVDNKEDLKISLNGKPFFLTPQNDKEYNFGKDYVELRQSSIYNINISNEPPINNLEEIIKHFKDKIDYIIEDKEEISKISSTIASV